LEALIYHGPRDLRVEERPDRELGPRQVRVAVRACGICGSELHAVLEATPRRPPGIVMGHEITGVVAEVGPGVTTRAVGDRVAVQPFTYCGTCALCRAARPNACERRALYGMTPGLPGGFAERVVVAEDRCFPIPDGVAFDVATLAEPLAVALHAIGRGPAERPRSVAILGCGTIGLMTLAAVSTLGPEAVFVADTQAWKLECAAALGATTLVAGDADVLSAVREATQGRGVDWAVDAVGVAETAALSLELARTGGHVTWIGNAVPRVAISLLSVVQAEKTVMGSYGYTDGDFRRSLGLVAEGRVPADWIAERRVSLESAPADLVALATGEWPCIKAVLVP